MYEVIVTGGSHTNRADCLNLKGVDGCAAQLARDIQEHHGVPYRNVRAMLLLDGIHVVTAAPHDLRGRADEALSRRRAER